jgi:hypothetical protein
LFNEKWHFYLSKSHSLPGVFDNVKFWAAGTADGQNSIYALVNNTREPFSKYRQANNNIRMNNITGQYAIERYKDMLKPDVLFQADHFILPVWFKFCQMNFPN